MSRTRYRFGEEHYPHFMTATIVAWLPVFSYPCFVEVILNSWRFLLCWPKWFDRCVYTLAVMVW